MFGFIENLKYGKGIRVRIGSFLLYIGRNNFEEDYPYILKKWYKRRTGKTLNLENPKTFNEKMQWLKIYDSTPVKTKLADKYEVRQWVKEKIGEEYLIPLLGVWDSFDDINFSSLPDKFVLKANHGSHWNIIVKDKSKLNIAKAKKSFDKWLKRDYSYKAGLELHYRGIRPKIIAEQFVSDSNNQLNDYKVLCFNGEPKFVWLDCGRYTKYRTKNIYDINWNLQPFAMSYKNSKQEIPAPENLSKMVDLARILCKDFSFVRVDFYNLDGKIYFGEMTFTSMSGVEVFNPEEYDLILGNMLQLPKKKS